MLVWCKRGCSGIYTSELPPNFPNQTGTENGICGAIPGSLVWQPGCGAISFVSDVYLVSLRCFLSLARFFCLLLSDFFWHL